GPGAKGPGWRAPRRPGRGTARRSHARGLLAHSRGGSAFSGSLAGRGGGLHDGAQAAGVHELRGVELLAVQEDRGGALDAPLLEGVGRHLVDLGLLLLLTDALLEVRVRDADVLAPLHQVVVREALRALGGLELEERPLV